MADNPFNTLVDIYTKQVEEADALGYAEVFKRATEKFFKDINSDEYKIKVTVKDVQYLDGYFIFGYGSNSVVHFHIQECPGWKFGIWWDIPTDVGVSGEFFAQFEETIDKFKPSASMITGDFLARLNDDDYWYVSSIRKQIEFIKDEPYLAFCRDYCFYNYNETCITREKAKEIYDDYKEHLYAETSLTSTYNEKILTWVTNNILTLFEDASIHDLGERWSPRYVVVAPFKKNTHIVDEPGCYGWFDEDQVELDKEYKRLLKEAQEALKAIGSYYFSPISKSVIFYGEDEDE